MRETYAIRITRDLLPPAYYPGYETREEAEKALGEIEREKGASYKVVYCKEYFNRAMDEEGNYTLSTIAELPDPNEPKLP